MVLHQQALASSNPMAHAAVAGAATLLVGVSLFLTNCSVLKNACFANAFSPYSIQKRPEPQIRPKFVP